MDSDDDDFRRDCALRGIEIMTAWADDDGDPTFVTSRLGIIAREEGQAGIEKTLVGLISVAGYALTLLAKETGKTEQDQLQYISRRLVQQWNRPEAG